MSIPYTPRPNSRANGRRHKTLGLSARQFNKVAGTLASARRGLREVDGEEEEGEEEYMFEERYEGREERVNGKRKVVVEEEEEEGDHVPSLGASRTRPALHPETSFAAESSFLRAPLNSRLPPPDSRPNGKGKGKERDRRGDEVRGLSLELQEAMVLEDLLVVLMGIEGTLITYASSSPHIDDPLSGAEFAASPSLDPSIRDLTHRLLPTAMHYTALAAFVQAKSDAACGLVNQALAGALRDILQEHITLLTRLEHAFLSPPTPSQPALSLQSLLPHLAPSTRTLSLLVSLTSSLLPLPPSSSSSSNSEEDEDTDEVDEEEERRNRELGLGGIERVMKGLAGVAVEEGEEEEGEVMGGEVVSVVWECVRRTAGDPLTPALLSPLLARLSAPYALILLSWVEHGSLQDPHSEFFVRENPNVARDGLEKDYTDEYWDRRYTLRDGTPTDPSVPANQRLTTGVPGRRAGTGRLPGGACVPPFLEPWKRKVLLAGKYLNVIRECGRDVGGRAEEWRGGMDCDPFYKRIEDAYTRANKTLLKLLIEDQELIPRLRSLKRYFFLSQSSFFTHFLDLAAAELKKPARGASVIKLQSLLGLAMNTPDEGVGGYKDSVLVAMDSMGLYDFLVKVGGVTGAIGEGWGGWGGAVSEKGSGSEREKERKEEKDKGKALIAMDAFQLDYKVHFPLSLVLSRKTILRYQLVFRFLFHLKTVEQALTAMWCDQTQPAWRSRGAPSRPPSTIPSRPPTSASTTRPPTAASARSSSRPPTPHSLLPSDLENWKRRVWSLRARMLAFVQQVLAYATLDVLEPNWGSLEKKLLGVGTVDQLLNDHVGFLDTCLKECMLTSSKLLRAYQKLLLTCSTFANYSAQFTKTIKAADLAMRETGLEPTPQEMQKRWDILQKFELNYNHNFNLCYDSVQFFASSENTKLLSLVVRLSSLSGKGAA